MPEQTAITSGGKLLKELIDEALGGKKAELPAGGDLSEYKKIFDDKDLVKTCFCLFENDLNVSRTAQEMYMHRNTLIYRISKLKRLTGLDVRKFDDAVSFIILCRCFESGRGVI